MKTDNLKKLLHKNRHKLHHSSNKENQLYADFIKIKELKLAKKAIVFNMKRNQIINGQLNKYLHPNSVHIRLKPYFDADIWVKWLGVLGDVTLPNKTNLNGSLLIDKISCYSDEKIEILDYHAWLNIENIKYIEHPDQQLAIGDYIEGISKVKQYGQGKYGLAATFIKKAGIFLGTNRPETLVSGYDRQDSWVVELSNNNLTKKNYTENYLTHNTDEFAANGAHVDAKFQPSRYKKFQQRLQALQQGESNDVLPLVNKSKETYTAEVIRSHAIKIPSIGHKMPQLEVKNIRNVASDRLIFAKYYLPYVRDIKKLGELKPGDKIQFMSEASPSNSGTFNMVTDFKLLTEHEFVPVPTNPNIFLGYIMWLHPEEGESSYIASYQNWALAKDIHTEKISNEIESLRPTSALSELELANTLDVDKKIVENARKQGLIKPTADSGLTRRYDAKSWDIMRKVIGAQDASTVEHLKDILPIFTTDDIVKQTGIDRSEVDTRIRQEEFFPLNGLHYSINVYGPRVMDLFKARKTVRNLLPNKNTIVTKREIPIDKQMPVPVEKPKKIDTDKILKATVNKTSTEPKKEDKQPIKTVEKAKATEPEKKIEVPKVKIIKHAEPKNEPIANKLISKPVATESAPIEAPKAPVANTGSTILLATFPDETKYEYSSPDSQIIEDIMQAAANPTINKMLQVKNIATQQIEIISVKAIMKMQVK